MLPRMNPPGFQIGVIGCAMPAVFQQRDISLVGPACVSGTCASQRRKLYLP